MKPLDFTPPQKLGFNENVARLASAQRAAAARLALAEHEARCERERCRRCVRLALDVDLAEAKCLA